MSQISELHTPATDQPGKLNLQRSGYFGTISKGASSVSDTVYVTVNAFGKVRDYQARGWMPRVIGQIDGHSNLHIIYPSPGDNALVGFDEDNLPWILVWSPYAT